MMADILFISRRVASDGAPAPKVPGGYDVVWQERPGDRLSLAAIRQSYSERGLCVDTERWVLVLTGHVHVPTAQRVEAYLRHLLEKHGDDLVGRIVGRFAMVLFDRHRQTLVAAIDRFGQCRLCYAATGGGIAIGSRLVDLRRVMETPPALNTQAIYEYFYFHMVPSPSTIFENVFKLEPASRITFQDGSIRTDRYWLPDFRENSISPDAKGDLYDALDQAVQRHLDDGAGTFLSGGLDSSTVTGLAALGRKKIPAYSIGYDVAEYDEMHFARIAADRFGIEHHIYNLQPADVYGAVDDVVHAYDEPFGNSSVIPTYMCARFAHEKGIRKMLAGDGGDELFAGNERYAKQKVFEKWYGVPAPVRSLLRLSLRAVPLRSRFFLTRKMDSYIRQAEIPLPDRLETYNYLNMDDPANIFTADFLSQVDTNRPADHLRRIYQMPKEASSLNRMMFLDWQRTLADNDLRKVNEMCRLAGIDVIYPMLDDRVVEVSTKIPSKEKLPGTSLRKFYKDTFSQLLPQEIINKPKHGFALPFGVWMKDYAPLREMAYASVDAMKSRGILQNAYMDDLLDKHQNVHPHYYGEFIWVIMILEKWLAANDF